MGNIEVQLVNHVILKKEKHQKKFQYFFHNGSKCDFHFIVTELKKYENQYTN